MTKKDEIIIVEKMFSYNKFVTRNAITDWIQSIRNMLGLDLIAYNNSINEATKQCMTKISGLKVKWFRIDVETMNQGSFLVKIYGELK